MKRVVVNVGLYDPAAHAAAHAVDLGGPSKTQQQFGESADVNVIMRRFGVSGVLPQVPGKGMYGDFTGVSEIRDAFDVVERAQARFRALDPAVRERFRNDPRELERFARSVDEETFYRSFQPEVPVGPSSVAGSSPAGAGVAVSAPSGAGVVSPVAGAS